MITNISNINFTKAPALQPIVKAIWSGVNNRFVSAITSSRFGLEGITLISGFILGTSTAWTVDHHSSENNDFQKHCRYILVAELSVLTIAGSIIFSLASKVNTKSVNIFAALVTGVILGAQIREYYNKNSDQKINEFTQGLIRFNGTTSIRLSDYRGCLSYFNLTKLGKKIHEIFNNNPELRLLDLSNTDLTDHNLKEMAETGLFSNVSTLILSNNPQLTGRGMAWLAEKGLPSLQKLDLSGNVQVIKTNLSEWVEKDGFKNLISLNLAATDIRENELEQMIEQTEWFRKLKGLNLDWNDDLRKFPSNILKLSNLDAHTVDDSQSGGGIYFYDAGLFCRGCNLTCTKELLQLAIKGKIFGEANHRSLNIKKIYERVGLKQVYQYYNMAFEEEDALGTVV